MRVVCAWFLMRLQDKYWWFYVTSFVTSFTLALQSALAPSISLRTFLSLLCFCVGIIGVGVLVPYKTFVDNLVRIFAVDRSVC